MKGYLVLIALGPVQDFIAQARRTRDLWFGSHLLSELARVCARELIESKALLIFPALNAKDPELHPCDAPLRESTRRPPLAIPNRLLAFVDEADDKNVEALCLAARAAVQTRWKQLADSALSKCKALIHEEATEALQEQVDSFVEFHAAWAPIESEHQYVSVRESLTQELAARKQLRDFAPWKRQRGAVPKSSLDGGRETIIKAPDARPPHLARRLRLSRGEQLDAIGLVKRAGGEPDQFVPIVNVALAMWIEVAKQRYPKLIEGVNRLCARNSIPQVRRDDIAAGLVFGYDAQVFLRDRWAPLLKELDGDDTSARRVQFEQELGPLLEKMGAPHPYVACLVADGDNMGKALRGLTTVEQQRQFSLSLSQFPTYAREVIEQSHAGVLVYAGGDDVLAFVPCAHALACAQSLRNRFVEIMRDALPSAAEPPTLTVGIGIGHILEGMGQLRALGQEAERLGKQKRDALGLVLDKRSGGRSQVVLGWSDMPVERLISIASLLSGSLSVSKVHELQRELAKLPPERSLLDREQRGWGALLDREFHRILGRASEGTGVDLGLLKKTFKTSTLRGDQSVWSAESYDLRRRELQEWLSCVLITRELGRAQAGHSEGSV